MQRPFFHSGFDRRPLYVSPTKFACCGGISKAFPLSLIFLWLESAGSVLDWLWMPWKSPSCSDTLIFVHSFLKKHFTWIDLEYLYFILSFQHVLLVSKNKRKMIYSVLRWMLGLLKVFFQILTGVLKHLLTPSSALSVIGRNLKGRYFNGGQSIKGFYEKRYQKPITVKIKIWGFLDEVFFVFP